MKLIPHWRKAWRMFSVQCMGIAIALQATWTQLPPELQSFVPAPVAQLITVALLVLGILGRIVAQPTIQPSDVCPHCGSRPASESP